MKEIEKDIMGLAWKILENELDKIKPSREEKDIIRLKKLVEKLEQK